VFFVGDTVKLFDLGVLFRDLFSDLIKYMHNSNRQICQATLSGKILIQDCKFYVLGFVPADVVRLNGSVWFRKLKSDEVDSVESFLAGSGYL